MKRRGIKRSNYEDLKRIVLDENFVEVVEALGRVALEESTKKDTLPESREALEHINNLLMESALKLSKDIARDMWE